MLYLYEKTFLVSYFKSEFEGVKKFLVALLNFLFIICDGKMRKKRS